MTLYIPSSSLNSTLSGPCVSSHFVRSVLYHKRLNYRLMVAGSDEIKPTWLLEYYNGAMPALRHGLEAYVHGSVIGMYLDFFWEAEGGKLTRTRDVGAGFFEVLEKLVVEEEDGGREGEAREAFMETLANITASLSPSDPYVGGEAMSLADLSLAPQLYYMTAALEEFEPCGVTLAEVWSEFPRLREYCRGMFEEDAFLHGLDYSKEDIKADVEHRRSRTEGTEVSGGGGGLGGEEWW
jgi:glutathione S-transferase